MTRSAPPALAIRLMNESMTDPAVIGDLVEEHARGRSAWWFWKQAIAASAPSPMNFLRWALAIPLAYNTANVVGRIELGMGWQGDLVLAPVWAFLFLVSAVVIVPSRKLFVAKTLLALIAIASITFIAFSSYGSMGGVRAAPMSSFMRTLVGCALIGAIAGFAVAYYFFDHRKATR